MTTITVRRIGNSLGVILPQETLNLLNVSEGDKLTLTQTPQGMQLSAYSADFSEQIKAAQKCIKQYRNALRELAK
jgi:putative addiction module antidote